MKHFRTIKWTMMAAMLCMPVLVSAQLMKGKIIGSDLKNITVVYSTTDDVLEREYRETQVNDGVFTFDADIPGESTDVEIAIDNGNVLGAHLVKGKTVEVTIVHQNGAFTASFKEEMKGVSPVVSKMATAYNIMRYFSLDPNDKTTYEDYRKLLDNECNDVKALLKGIKDKKARQYYTALNEAKYKEQKLRLLSDRAYNEKKKPADYPEYVEILKDVDINDMISFRSGLSLTKLLSKVDAEQAFKGDMGPYCKDIMQQAEQYVTNKALRRSIVNTVGYNYFTFGDNSGDYHAFFDEYKKFAGAENADVPAKYASVIASWDKTKSGIPAPDITLTDKDGNQVQLKDICKGQFTYIDVWATWCGPCKKEIPFMEKTVERFKDNDKVMFISISIDEDVNAWKKMIENDKPQWPQYNINKQTAKQFSTDWGITGIPRFIMIDKNGNIFAADASRPSEEKTAMTIEEQTK
ncbi:MAG: redoxin family protein [Prevotella sp.]|nr:redoxin family protein [Prevotella sp.]